MAEVFQGHLCGIGGFERDVAVKVLLPEFSSEPEFVEMLLDEARIAGAINHPCVVQVIDIGRTEELFYLVMEHVDGGDLRGFLKRAPHHTLPLTCALFLVSEVLRGLQAVHTAVDPGGVPRRIVHRDVSPANVMLARSGAVKLGDFGIAHASSRLTRTRNGAVKGKLKYMAPEQLASGKVDHRADLYAVGVMLCEILLGDRVCEPRRMTPYGAVFAWTPRLGQWLPPDVAQIVARALAEDPAQRFVDAAQFRREVAAALARRAPGYGAEELSRELASLDEGFLSELPTIASQSISLYTDGGSVTIPQQKLPDGPPLLRDAPPILPTYVARVPSAPVSLRPPLWNRKTALWAVGAAAATSLLVAALLLVGASSAARSRVVASEPAPVVRPLAAAQVSTGTLAVDGPPGASMMIGATVYPAGRVELPPGEYQVTLKRRARSRPFTRHVTIAAGAVTPIKL